MNRPTNNATLIRMLCGPRGYHGGSQPRYARVLLLAAASAFLAIPAAICVAELTDPFALLHFVSGRLALLLSPGNLLITPQPQTIADFLKPPTHHYLLTISVDWLYWFLIIFGLSCFVSGISGMRRPDK